MDNKSPHVKSKKITMSQLPFQNNEKSNAENDKSQDIELQRKNYKITAQECDINDQKRQQTVDSISHEQVDQ